MPRPSQCRVARRENLQDIKDLLYLEWLQETNFMSYILIVVSCYQCAWSPGRTVYKTITYYDQEKVADPYSYNGGYMTKHVKRTKQVEKIQQFQI